MRPICALLLASLLPLTGCATADPVSSPEPYDAYRIHPFLSFDTEDSLTADVALADLDNDGDLDVLAANGRHWAQQDFAFLNDGTGRLLEATRIGERLSASYVLCPADLDRDGDIDLVEGTETTNAVYLNDGKAGFTRHSFGEDADTYGIAIGDMNGDGKPDLVFANSESANTVLTAR